MPSSALGYDVEIKKFFANWDMEGIFARGNFVQRQEKKSYLMRLIISNSILFSLKVVTYSLCSNFIEI